MKQIKSWQIKKGMNGSDNLKAVQALVFMMEISISDKEFREYADNQPELYELFELTPTTTK